MGQHFLTDQNIAKNIAATLSGTGYSTVLEIGPGMGMLTQYLLQHSYSTHVIEIDTESIDYLKTNVSELENRIIEGDFLKLDLTEYFDDQVAIIGNFPYNISSQILFRVIEQRHLVPEFAGMFQKKLQSAYVKSLEAKHMEYYLYLLKFLHPRILVQCFSICF